jgi:hypothetical protein
MYSTWQQGDLDNEHVSGVHLPGVDAGCGVVSWKKDGIINELAAVQLPPELEITSHGISQFTQPRKSFLPSLYKVVNSDLFTFSGNS